MTNQFSCGPSREESNALLAFPTAVCVAQSLPACWIVIPRSLPSIPTRDVAFVQRGSIPSSALAASGADGILTKSHRSSIWA